MTHLSSVNLMRVRPSVEKTMNDIRNCGLNQALEMSSSRVHVFMLVFEIIIIIIIREIGGGMFLT